MLCCAAKLNNSAVIVLGTIPKKISAEPHLEILARVYCRDKDFELSLIPNPNDSVDPKDTVMAPPQFLPVRPAHEHNVSPALLEH
jgi:hypothetical protein